MVLGTSLTVEPFSKLLRDFCPESLPVVLVDIDDYPNKCQDNFMMIGRNVLYLTSNLDAVNQIVSPNIIASLINYIVFEAALNSSFSECLGVEIVKERHEQAIIAQGSFIKMVNQLDIWAAPIRFTNTDLKSLEKDLANLEGVSVIFTHNFCFGGNIF